MVRTPVNKPACLPAEVVGPVVVPLDEHISHGVGHCRCAERADFHGRRPQQHDGPAGGLMQRLLPHSVAAPRADGFAVGAGMGERKFTHGCPRRDQVGRHAAVCSTRSGAAGTASIACPCRPGRPAAVPGRLGPPASAAHGVGLPNLLQCRPYKSGLGPGGMQYCQQDLMPLPFLAETA